MSSPSERLLNLTGGNDLTKHPSVTQEVLREVLTELQDKQREQAKEKAHQLLAQCVELQKKKNQAEREFQAAQKKFDKELGKLLSQLERSLGGQPEQPEQEAEEPASE